LKAQSTAVIARLTDDRQKENAADGCLPLSAYSKLSCWGAYRLTSGQSFGRSDAAFTPDQRWLNELWSAEKAGSGVPTTESTRIRLQTEIYGDYTSFSKYTGCTIASC